MAEAAGRPFLNEAFGVLWLSGDATSNTLLPTLSWKLARGSAGSSPSGAEPRLKRPWRVGDVLNELDCCDVLLTLLGVRFILDDDAEFHVLRLEFGVCG
jgi:hypothetical protein